VTLLIFYNDTAHILQWYCSYCTVILLIFYSDTAHILQWYCSCCTVILLILYSDTAHILQWYYYPTFETLPFFSNNFLGFWFYSLRQYPRLFYPLNLYFSGIKLSYMFRLSSNMICTRTCSWVLCSTDVIVCFTALIFKMQGDESLYALLNKVMTNRV
jgi:hypothetical protein